MGNTVVSVPDDVVRFVQVGEAAAARPWQNSLWAPTYERAPHIRSSRPLAEAAQLNRGALDARRAQSLRRAPDHGTSRHFGSGRPRSAPRS